MTISKRITQAVEMIRVAEKGCRARLFDTARIESRITAYLDSLPVPLKLKAGIILTIAAETGTVASSYKGIPETTYLQVKILSNGKDWKPLKAYRSHCKTSGYAVTPKFPADTKGEISKKILESYQIYAWN